MATVALVKGSIPDIILNREGLYRGDLKHYFKVLFNNAKNLNNPYHNFRHMFCGLYIKHVNFITPKNSFGTN